MATFKAIVSSYLKDDNTRNVLIYVYHKGKKRYPATNYFLSKDDLTKSMKIKNQMYTDALDEILKKCRTRCNDNASRIGDMEVDQVVELVLDIIEGREEANKAFRLNIIEYGKKYIESLEEQNISGNSKVYKVALNNLEKFVGRDSLDINEITTRFVNDWIKWIRERPSNRAKGGRAESLYPETIRSLHNLAKDEYNNEDIGDIKIPLSPFKKARIPELPGKIDIDLSVEDLRAIHNLPYTESVHLGNNKFNLAKDVFMLSFMLIGMNIADLYNCTNYSNGRITYYRTKVKNRREDMGLFSVKVEPEVLPLINKYRDPSKQRVFNFYKMYSSVDTFTAAVNGLSRKNKKGKVFYTGLKKVGEAIGVKGLKFYSARHTWATITRNNVGIDKYTVHEALNHVDDDMKATDIYLKRDWSQIDKANRATLDYVFKPNL
jgi:integrase